MRTPTTPPVIESPDEWCPGSRQAPADIFLSQCECPYCGRSISLFVNRLARHKMPPRDTHEADDGQ
jgi:hypothetical protein